jgi:deoxyribose-phosphate aldolase
MSYTREQIIPTLDIAVLKPTANPRDVWIAAETVEREGAASVCVPPLYVAVAKINTDRVCSVIGFPHGNTTPGSKRQEASVAIGQGAAELDVVLSYGLFLAGHVSRVRDELMALVRLAHKQDVLVKAILEICYYTPAQIADACRLCVDCGADWVKTSTGFAESGATLEAVKIMVDAVAGWAKVKASGGIKTYIQACDYLDAGCTRLGVGFTNYEGLLP